MSPSQMKSIEGKKVITAEEMVRIEKLSFQAGASDLTFMENAGAKIAELVEEFILLRGLQKEIVLLVGKGNNGGDALHAASRLLAKGYSVQAFQIYPSELCSSLCKKQSDLFKKAGGKIISVKEGDPFPEISSRTCHGAILDGLVGTGFKGKPDRALTKAIQAANESSLPILSVDIPSGLNGNTGQTEGEAIYATKTFYLSLPKIGFFIGSGWNHVGELCPVDFGLKESFIDRAKPEAYLVNEEILPSLLPPIVRNRHKYQAGYLLALAGSSGLSGAAFLATRAALRAGAGVVRLFHSAKLREELAAAPWEVVKEELKGTGIGRILEEMKRAHALLIGPGLGRGKESEKKTKELLQKSKLPTLLDADALYFLAENPKWRLPEHAVITPHKKEMERLLRLSKPEKEEKTFHALCQKFVQKHKITLLLKGGPTFVMHPDETPLIVTRGDPGMATAGTGDVLSGIIAALLAQRVKPRLAAALGATLHGIAGEIASFQKTSYSLIASDLIETLPDAFIDLQ